MTPEPEHKFTRRLADVIAHWETCVNGEAQGPSSRTFGDRWTSSSRHGFYGATVDEMRDWIRSGYPFDTIGGLPPIDTPTERRRYRWTDDPEGEFDYPAFLNGETDYYRKREPQKKRGGVRIEVRFGFMASAPAQVLAEYGQFVGEVIRTIQARGADVELRLSHLGRNCYSRSGHQGSDLTQTDIVVSEFGEKVMAAQWSALFSPGGYRHLGFAARLMAEAEGYHVNDGMGRNVFTRWGLDWEPRGRTLTLRCDGRGRSFPTEQMRDELSRLKTGI